MKFDLPKENSSIIKVIGVGGGGSNAVNHMYQAGINGVDFMVCNTDQQALDISPVPLKVQLGSTLTEGRGAGSIPDVGKNAASENIDEIKEILNKNTKMVFITAGMGGGTGTGAAPVIARVAKEMGILTVGIVTMPFFFEGRKRRQQAEQGIEEIRESVDTLLIINNEKLREMCGNLPIAAAFAMADDVLSTAAKGIAEIITRTGYINVDFEDVRTVMVDSGVAIMGSASAAGEDRATKAVEKALSSPLLNDNNIEGARYVLLNISFGNEEVLMDEISDITDYIQGEAGSSADVIWGYGIDESLGDKLSVTIIATGFNSNPNTGVNLEKKVERVKHDLEEQAQAKTPVIAETPKVEEPKAENEPFLKTAFVETPRPQTPLMDQRVFEFEMPVSTSQPQIQNEVVESEKRYTSLGEDDVEDEIYAETEIEQVEEAFEEPFVKAPIVNEVSHAEPEVKAQQAPQQEERKEWEPFIKASSIEQKPIVNEQPTFKTTTPASPSSQQSYQEDRPSREEQARVANDRLSRLRELSMKLRSSHGMSDLENEPAFRRKQINLEDVPHSSQSSASRFSINEEENMDGEKRNRLSGGNKFFTDSVD
ncbi:MAG: cell division protein FtsZ [Salibacteraceae bacterium]|nr:cell division protein FtsZ [Salibacteraceae bacterium]